jgi:hypothetical protein
MSTGVPVRKQALRSRHQRQFPQRVAAIRHFRRQRVVFAPMCKGLIVERVEDDIDLFLEQFAVGFLVQQRGAERLNLARQPASVTGQRARVAGIFMMAPDVSD